ncbi:MAG: hypothetical protein U5N85_18455 [Arcicella sp.]|nr:hypothetical protein [Arcicella sp.]
MLTFNDCTHTWAKALENLYKDDANFIDFLRSVSALRRKWILSKNSHLLPPPMRVKSRFYQVFNQKSPKSFNLGLFSFLLLH